jgi:Protein of unknown function (DUF2889)
VALTLGLGAASHTLEDIHADGGPDDLPDLRPLLGAPWAECPAAVASAERLWGTTFDDLRLRVRRELVGTASCTHLNDTLRSLADLGALLSPREGP